MTGMALLAVGYSGFVVVDSELSVTWVTAAGVLIGIGMGLANLTTLVAVQNAVPHSELGVATSGATFFRSIGGSFGTAIFGAIFSNVLVGNLARHLHVTHLPAGFHTRSVTPSLLSHLPAPIHHAIVAGYAESIQTVFLVAVPIAALAFLATWLIPQVELKKWTGGEAVATAEPAVESRQ